MADNAPPLAVRGPLFDGFVDTAAVVAEPDSSWGSLVAQPAAVLVVVAAAASFADPVVVVAVEVVVVKAVMFASVAVVREL